MQVNGDSDEVEVATFTASPYTVRVGAYVGADESVVGGVYRQVAVEWEDEEGAVCELLLSVDEASQVYVRLAEAVTLAARHPAPSAAPSTSAP